jgi:two-component system response regulator NreC
MSPPVSPESTITLVLADDHTVMRSGLRMLLDAEEGFEVLAEAGDVLAALQAVRNHRPDVLVLDLNMPGGSSIDAIRRLAPISPGTAVVVLTMEEDRAFVREALDAGAKGYVQKHAAGRVLVRAIRDALTAQPRSEPWWERAPRSGPEF